MKKIYVWLFVTAGIILTVNAQPFEKGDKLLGGTLGISSTNPSGSDNSNSVLSVNPSIGFFTKSNRLTGFSLLVNSDLNSQHSFGASVYKQYWNNLGKNVYFIMQGEFAARYNTSKSGDRNNPNTGRQHIEGYTVSGSLSPGLAYRLNRRLVINAFLANFVNLSYNHSTIENVYTNSNFKRNINSVSLNTGLNGFSLNNIQFGFYYILK